MLTVSDVLSLPILSDTRICAGESGLCNEVLQAGFFEWEELSDIPKYFDSNEFIITTLSSAKGNSAESEHIIRSLIYNRPAAILIKDVFFKDLPDSVKQLADKKCVPIVFFSNAYIDRIFYSIYQLIEMSKSVSNTDNLLSELYNKNPDTRAVEYTLARINPAFLKDAFSILYISDDEIMCSDGIDRYYKEFLLNRDMFSEINVSGLKSIFSIIRYKRGLLIIVSYNVRDSSLISKYEDRLLSKLKRLPGFDELFIGTGYSLAGCADFVKAFKNAIFANVTAILDKQHFVRLDDVDFDYTIYSNINNKAVCEYFDHLISILKDPANKKTMLLETILAYVEADGNIQQAASKLFQHQNTIRYRIEHVKNIFGTEQSLTLYSQLYYFSRIYLARPYLSMFFNNQ